MTAITRKLNLLIPILTLAFVVGTGPAMAGRNANGAMVLHTDDAVSYSLGWDYCADPTPTRVPSHAERTGERPGRTWVCDPASLGL